MNHRNNKNRAIRRSANLLFILAIIAILGISPQTSRAAGCSAVNYSVVFKSLLHTDPLQSGANIIATADFNRDGNLDFAIANEEADLVSVFLGNGKGGFTVSTLTSATAPRNIFARDFNRDGRMDLLVSSGFSSIAIFNGNGSGGFTLGTTMTGGNGYTTAVADFNLDGIEDFAIQQNSNVEVRLGVGNGTFGSPILTPQTNITLTATAADFNRDGKPDLVLGAFSDSQIFFLPGNGAGGFGAVVSFNAVSSSNRFLTTEDLNGDGRLDLIVGGNSPIARIFFGAATGVFSAPTTISGATNIFNAQTGDFNDDGKVDLLVYRDAVMEVRLGNGDGTFAAAALTTPMETVGANTLIPADFNNDGKIDFAATDRNEAFVGLNRCGGLTTKPEIDFDGDGQSDIAVFRPSTGQWFVLRSIDNSFFSFSFGTSGDIPAAGDYDGDLLTDAAVFRPSTATWFISRSSGGTSIFQFGASGDQPRQGDYDGDGKTDVAIFRPSDGSWWYSRSSNGATIALQFGANGDIPIR